MFSAACFTRKRFFHKVIRIKFLHQNTTSANLEPFSGGTDFLGNPSEKKKKRHQQPPVFEHTVGYYGLVMLHCTAILHRLKQMPSNCSPPVCTLKNLPIIPGLLIPHPAVLPTSPLMNGFWFAGDWLCSTQTTNNWLNCIFFLLENTRVSQYGIAKIKSLSTQ